MPEETTPIDALKALVQSEEFATVRLAANSIDDILLLDPSIGAHLNAFRVGMGRLAVAPELQPEPEGEPEE